MRLFVFSVFDKAVSAYLSPFYARTVGEAVRSFSELANDPQRNVYRTPADFVLYGLGEFDDGSGMFTSVEPERIIGAHEVLVDVSSPVKRTA